VYYKSKHKYQNSKVRDITNKSTKDINKMIKKTLSKRSRKRGKWKQTEKMSRK
jgi:hypothetical protein